MHSYSWTLIGVIQCDSSEAFPSDGREDDVNEVEERGHEGEHLRHRRSENPGSVFHYATRVDSWSFVFTALSDGKDMLSLFYKYTYLISCQKWDVWINTSQVKLKQAVGSFSLAYVFSFTAVPLSMSTLI